MTMLFFFRNKSSPTVKVRQYISRSRKYKSVILLFYVELYVTPQVRFCLLGSHLLFKTALHEFACQVPVCSEISKEDNITLDDR